VISMQTKGSEKPKHTLEKRSTRQMEGGIVAKENREKRTVKDKHLVRDTRSACIQKKADERKVE